MEKKPATIKINATIAIDATTAIVIKKPKHITSTIATQVAMTKTKLDDEHMDVNKDNISRSTVSSDAVDDNFAVFESPAKLAAKAKHGRAVADKEVTAARKRKPNTVTAPRQGKKAKSNKKIIESDSDEEDDDDENFLASCGKVLDRDSLNI